MEPCASPTKHRRVPSLAASHDDVRTEHGQDISRAHPSPAQLPDIGRVTQTSVRELGLRDGSLFVRSSHGIVWARGTLIAHTHHVGDLQNSSTGTLLRRLGWPFIMPCGVWAFSGSRYPHTRCTCHSPLGSNNCLARQEDETGHVQIFNPSELENFGIRHIKCAPGSSFVWGRTPCDH